jgi:hypothetical protein
MLAQLRLGCIEQALMGYDTASPPHVTPGTDRELR